MPILQSETYRYPDQLLNEGECRGLKDGPERNWWVLQTKPRQEKSVARALLAKQVPFYLPIVKKDNFCRGRRTRSHIPLFSSYAFFFGDESERIAALETNRIAQMLSVTDQEEMWKDLRQIARLIEADAPLTLEARLGAGRRVRIKAGPLKGVEGTVLDRRSGARLLVSVRFLQAGASIEIEDYMLEPLD